MNAPRWMAPATTLIPPLPGIRWAGPERRGEMAAILRCVTSMLDLFDHGILLTTDAGRVLHMNAAATRALQSAYPLAVVGDQVVARDGRHAPVLQEALRAASRAAEHRMVVLDDPDGHTAIGVLPVDAGGMDGPPLAAIMLGRDRLVCPLTLENYARARGITSAEVQVLHDLGEGTDPAEIARAHDVALSTVRTQIGSLRAKIDAGCIRTLLQRIAMLPPMVGALRGGRRLSGQPAVNDATATLRA